MLGIGTLGASFKALPVVLTASESQMRWEQTDSIWSFTATTGKPSWDSVLSACAEGVVLDGRPAL